MLWNIGSLVVLGFEWGMEALVDFLLLFIESRGSQHGVSQGFKPSLLMPLDYWCLFIMTSDFSIHAAPVIKLSRLMSEDMYPVGTPREF